MDHIFKNRAYHIFEVFLTDQCKDYSLREIARKLNISHATVINHTKRLMGLNLIKQNKNTLYPTYYANTENQVYRDYKKDYIVHEIKESDLIKFIEEKIFPSSIILFGSCGKGEFTEKSDIDIFVEAKAEKLDLKKYEKKLKREINIIFEPNLKNLSNELKNNIINGTILSGFLKVY